MDRNTTIITICIVPRKSLSARRAWIEIKIIRYQSRGSVVALRKESVDRNVDMLFQLVHGVAVALRKESVDRNLPFGRLNMRTSCRSPQGERG